ncbi:hypothetical protein EMCRGX_G006839 [Ephydatia muelleri]
MKRANQFEATSSSTMQDAPLLPKRSRPSHDGAEGFSADCTQQIECHKEIKKPEVSLICRLCSQLYTDPRMLSCLHCFCRECLHKEVGSQSALKESRVKGSQLNPQQDKGAGPIMNCPTCQKPVTIPVGGVKDIPQDFHLDNEVKIAQYQSKVARKDAVPCDICIGGTSLGPAVGFCCSCHHFMCQQCCDHHKLAQHDMIALDETVPKERLSAVKPTCALHSKELVFYCETCCCLICHDCTTSDHKDHKQNTTLQSIASSCRADIRKLLPSAQEVVSKLAVAVNGNVKILKEVKENEMAAIQSIKQTFYQLRQALDSKRNELLSEVHAFALSKQTALIKQKKTFETQMHDISHCSDVASTVLQKYTDCEIIALKKLPYAELRGSVSKAQRVSLEPCECSDIVKVALRTDSYQNSLSKMCHLIDFCPGKSAWNSASSSCIVGSPFMLRVKANNSNGQDYPYDDIQLKVVLKPQGAGSGVVGNVVQHRNGEYSISLNPVSSGPHLLNITMNGQHIQKSPQQLYVKDKFEYEPEEF